MGIIKVLMIDPFCLHPACPMSQLVEELVDTSGDIIKGEVEITHREWEMIPVLLIVYTEMGLNSHGMILDINYMLSNLTNIAAAKPKETKVLLLVLPLLITHLGEKSSSLVVEISTGALGNVANEGEGLRNVLIFQGVLPSLARMMLPNKGSTYCIPIVASTIPPKAPHVMYMVEELKILVRMFPIEAIGIIFAAVYSQISTMFVEQGMVMDATIRYLTNLAASLCTFDVISVMCWMLSYDGIIVSIARKFSVKERGFSKLQRMGIDLFISVLTIVAAGLVEIKHLQHAKEFGLINDGTPIPISILWQIPQYMWLGNVEVTFIKQFEYFYGQSPYAMLSLWSALSLSKLPECVYSNHGDLLLN